MSSDKFSFYSLSGAPGPDQPSGNFTQWKSMLYATTHIGGSANGGTLFSIDPSLTTCTKLVDFEKPPNTGFYVRHGSLVSHKSLLYGVTTRGGTDGGGLFYSYPKFTTLCSFEGSSGSQPAWPHSNPIRVGSTFYGLSQQGGVSKNGEELGTIFKIDDITSTSASVSVLHEFDGTSGGRPHSAPTYVESNNSLYGMTRVGGPDWSDSQQALGVIFRFDLTTSEYSVIYDFSGTKASGATPYHNNLLLVDDVFYGMTHGGGKGDKGQPPKPDSGNGVIFSINLDGTDFSILHLFREESPSDGCNPLGTLIVDGRASHSTQLYGTTEHGGDHGDGTLFRINMDGSDYKTLHNFKEAHGKKPADSLLWFENKLYGLTVAGGAFNAGVAFSFEVS